MDEDKCIKYIDMLLASGFHKNTSKEAFFEDFKNLHNHCNIKKSEMNMIKLALIYIKSCKKIEF